MALCDIVYFVFLFALLQPVKLEYSGYMEIKLRSAFPLNVTVETAAGIYFPSNKKVYKLALVPGKVATLTNLPVTFHRPGIVLFNSGPVEKFGLKHEIIRSERWSTQQMIISPLKLHLPFTGLRIEIKCDRHWHGIECNKFCNDRHAEAFDLRCTDTGELGCQKGFRGVRCNEPIVNSSPDCGCQNKGICVSTMSNYYRNETMICECPLGFEGPKCAKKAYDYRVPLVVDMYGTRQKWTLVNQFFNNSLVDNDLYKSQ